MTETVEIPAPARELRDARKAAGLTQRELAVRAGCAVTTIANWEQGLIPRAYSRVWGIVWDTLASINDEGRPPTGAPVQKPVEQDRHAGP